MYLGEEGIGSNKRYLFGCDGCLKHWPLNYPQFHAVVKFPQEVKGITLLDGFFYCDKCMEKRKNKRGEQT